MDDDDSVAVDLRINYTDWQSKQLGATEKVTGMPKARQRDADVYEYFKVS